MSKVIDEVKNLYRIILFDDFRKTPGVVFDMIPVHMLGQISAVDRVLHQLGAVSPGPVGSVERPWYMHEFQDDNLVVLSGTRIVDIYTPGHGRIEQFTVTPTRVSKNGEVIAEGGGSLGDEGAAAEHGEEGEIGTFPAGVGAQGIGGQVTLGFVAGAREHEELDGQR